MSRVRFVIRSLLSSLQLRLILGVTLLFLGSLWGFAWLLAMQQTARIEHLLIEQQQATIGYVAEDLDQRLRRRLDNLVQAATILPLELLGDPARLEETLRQRPLLHKSFDGGVIVVKPDGSGAFADYPPVPGRREHGYEHFTAVGDVIRSGRPSVGKPFIGMRIKQPMLGFAVPMRDRDGRLAAILAGVSALQAPDLLGIVGQHRYGKTGDFVVVAPQHDMVVIGTNPADIMRPLPKPGVNVMLDRFRAGAGGLGHQRQRQGRRATGIGAETVLDRGLVRRGAAAHRRGLRPHRGPAPAGVRRRPAALAAGGGAGDAVGAPGAGAPAAGDDGAGCHFGRHGAVAGAAGGAAGRGGAAGGKLQPPAGAAAATRDRSRRRA